MRITFLTIGAFLTLAAPGFAVVALAIAAGWRYLAHQCSQDLISP